MPDDITRYDDFWAGFFGLPTGEFRAPGVHVVRHARLGNYQGVWFFVRGSSVVVSTPDARLERFRSHIDRIAAEPLPGSQLLRELLDRDPDRVIGPVYQGYLLSDAFQPARDGNVRRLNSSDEPALLALRSACTSQEWEYSGLSAASEPRFGYFQAGHLAAVAGEVHWTSDAVGPGALSHPDQRGRGYATAVVSAVVEHALAAGKLVLYQTLLTDEKSVAIAKRLGYGQYATHMAVRVQATADPGGNCGG